jgi:hypothetical protein
MPLDSKTEDSLEDATEYRLRFASHSSPPLVFLISFGDIATLKQMIFLLLLHYEYLSIVVNFF